MSLNAPSAEDAENALCDLNTAYAIIALCEGGLFRTPSGHRFADRIVRQYKDHAQKTIERLRPRQAHGCPMTRKTELLELAERVEAAKHPPEAWELLEEAWHLVAPLEQSDLAGFTRREASFWMFMDADAFLDAAMTLKPSGEGHWPQLIMTGTNPNNPSRQKERCEIWAKGYLKPFRGHAATPALALCAAALRAHAEMCDE